MYNGIYMVSGYNNYNSDYKNKNDENDKKNSEETSKDNSSLISNKLLSDNLDLEISLEKVPF